MTAIDFILLLKLKINIQSLDQYLLQTCEVKPISVQIQLIPTFGFNYHCVIQLTSQN